MRVHVLGLRISLRADATTIATAKGVCFRGRKTSSLKYFFNLFLRCGPCGPLQQLRHQTYATLTEGGR